jgi:hypothetical protein
MSFTAVDVSTPFGCLAALKSLGIQHQEIADEAGVHQTLVGQVIRRQRWTGPQGRRVMNVVCSKLGLPIDDVFPFHNRRKPPAD